MANAIKVPSGGTGILFNHFSRAKDEFGEYIKFGNQEIDLERTHLNYNLAKKDQHLPQIDFLRLRLNQVKRLKRKDVNVICSWITTLPKDIDKTDTAKVEDFFQKSYDFLCDRYGVENCVSSYVHMDETQPHMHFCFIPVQTLENGQEKLNAKVIMSRTDLKTFHPEYQKYLDENSDYKFNVHTGITGDKNKSIGELKKETEEQVEENKKVISEQEETKSSIGKDIRLLNQINKEKEEDFYKIARDIERFEGKLEKLEEECEVLKKSNSELLEQFNNSQDNYSKLENKVQTKKNELTETTSKLKNVTSELLEVENRTKPLREEEKDLKEQNKGLKDEIEGLRKDKTSIKKELLQETAELIKEKAVKQEELDKITSETESKTSQLKELEESVGNLQAEKKRLNAIIDDTIERSVEEGNKLQELQSDVSRAEGEVKRAEEKLEKVEKRTTSLEDEIGRLELEEKEKRSLIEVLANRERKGLEALSSMEYRYKKAEKEVALIEEYLKQPDIEQIQFEMKDWKAKILLDRLVRHIDNPEVKAVIEKVDKEEKIKKSRSQQKEL